MMKKGWKRVLACVLALTLFAGYLPTKMNQVVNAEESNSQQETNLKFGDTDTYLQLSNPLSAAPQAIEATVNMPEIESEWTLCVADNISVNNATESEVKTVGNTVTVGPKEGTSYRSITMPSNEEFVFEHKFNDVQVPYTYTNEDVALAFWMYSDKAVTLNQGNIELTSSGTCDHNEIDWAFAANDHNVALKAGWNYVELPLEDMRHNTASNEGSEFDLQELNYFRWHSLKFDEDMTIGLTDVKLIVLDGEENYGNYTDGEWTLADVNGTISIDAIGQNSASKPETEGKVLELDVKQGKDCINQNFVSSMTIPSSYKLTGAYNTTLSGDDADNLCVDFWIYTPSDSFKAWFKFWQNSNEILRYNLANQTIQPGWNHIQIPLNKLAYQPTSSSSDFSKLNRVTITAHGVAVEGTYYISDIRIIDTDIYNLVDESVYNATALNYMVFSNLNATSEDNQTALFVTKTGNPAFVWGNQQYTLNKNVCTGKDVKIKVVRAAGDKIQFYINEKLIETCVTNTTDLNAPTTAHCIGGDAAGKQIMNGSISNLKVYSDATLITCIGNWELTGNIQNVTGTMSDSSANANTAVFRGSRADDWSDYQVPGDIKNEICTLVSAHSFSYDRGNSSVVAYNEVTNVKEGAHAQTIDYKRQTAIYKTDHYRIDYTKKELSVDLSTYNLDDLAVEFWMKSSNTETTKLSEKSFLEFRNSKNDAIIFKGTAITLQSGEWTKITLPLKDATTKTIKDDKNDKIITNVRLLVRDIHESEDIYVSDMKIVKVEQNPWSLVYIPDMENLTANDAYNATWKAMSQWIADNAKTENIQHVIGGGDTTLDNSETAYTCAMEGYRLFMDAVSWSTMVGYNDYAKGYTNRDASNYQATFCEAVIKASAASDTYKGSYVDSENKSTTENSYYRFNVNGVKWMILQLEYAPREEVLVWADGIIKEHPLDNVILATPGYLNGYGAKLKIGETVWSKLSGNQNIKMILCGHSTNGTGAIAQATEKYSNDTGSVPVLMMNAQDLDAGADAYYTDRPLGMISILRFSADGKNVAVQYYSPTEGKSFSPDDNFGKANSNSITFEIDTEVCTPIITPYGEEYGTPFAAATAPDNIPDGYIFAGWFTDEACTTALKANDNAEQAYAKFVDAEVLSVKAQVRLDEIKDDDDKVTGYKLPEDKTDMRFVTTVDSTKYREVGFEITAKDSTGQDKTIKVGSEFVYEYLYAVGKVGTEGAEPMSYTPSDICSPQSTLFKTFTVTDIPVAKYGETFSVRAYWITQDGTTVYGYEEPVTKTVTEGTP